MGRFIGLAPLYAHIANGTAVRDLMLKHGPLQGTYQVLPAADTSYGNVSGLPALTVLGSADTPGKAVAMTRRASEAFIAYLGQRQTEVRISPGARVETQILNVPSTPPPILPRKRPSRSWSSWASCARRSRSSSLSTTPGRARPRNSFRRPRYLPRTISTVQRRDGAMVGPGQLQGRFPLLPAVLAAMVAVLAATIVSGHGMRPAAYLTAAVALLSLAATTIKRWHTFVCLIVVLIMFVPIRRYQFRTGMPFDLEPYRILVGVVTCLWIAGLLVDRRLRLRRSGFEGPLALFLLAILGSILTNEGRLRDRDHSSSSTASGTSGRILRSPPSRRFSSCSKASSQSST